ncbi:MAG: NAD(P)(+) transhydrogenase (Re/Si-specific) subunit alpha [Verrucomicrobiales bacterium]|nr:NAD(P)(+) transhydrogenase (Re/Si-specific) subunit alpha [Verrucomicrobiales bacterium]|tara:strand:- start:4956 stop:6080 length:1125 start_codon:yes stop_codon:yes gene_type:complete
MTLGVPTELSDQEPRVALVPDAVRRLRKLEAEVLIESGLGKEIGLPDADYEKAGAVISKDRREVLEKSDVLLRVRPPSVDDLEGVRADTLQIGCMDPFKSGDLIGEFAKRKLNAIAMELVPRITRAQKMDVLSSQANLAGYVAVVIAADQLDRIFPMMTTAAGTIAPARVFVLGAGVAGLQAIATAKRMGARVEAYDVRPEVAEQVKSVGGKFVEIDVGQTESTKDGYAKALTDEQIKKQQEAMASICSRSDVVITTANVFGGKAPRLVTAEMLDAMKPGSVVIDMAVESGGNVEGIEADKVISRKDVSLIGYSNLPARVPVHASQVYAANLVALIEEFWNQETKALELKPDDEILKSCLLTHQGEIVNERFKS